MTVLLNRPNSDQVTIAREAGIDRTNVADVLSRLEQRNIVKRKTSGTDRRMRLSKLTENGEVIAREMETASIRAQTRFFSTLSKTKQQQLLELMTELVRANNEFSRAPAQEKDG